MKKSPESPCPGCGAFARVFQNGKSTCAYCGATLQPLPFTHNGGICPLESPLSLGLRARIEGKEYVAVGRLAYDVTEDEVEYPWEEWVLLSQDGEARYLEFEEGKWVLSQAWPDGPEVEKRVCVEGAQIQTPVGEATCFAAGLGRLTGAEGEIPWPIQIGERVPYADFRVGETVLSAEWDHGEVEWFRGRRLDSTQVLEMFGLKQMAAEQERIQNTTKDRARFGCVSVVLAILAFSSFAWALNVPGRTVAVQSTTADKIPETGLPLPKLWLGPGGRVHRLELTTNGLSSSSLWVQAILEDDAGAVADHDAEFWDESGYDEDGVWHEWDFSSRTEFRVSKPGFHQVRLKADPELAGSTAPVTVRVAAAAMDPAPLLWYGFFASIVATVSLIFAAVKRNAWSGKSVK